MFLIGLCMSAFIMLTAFITGYILQRKGYYSYSRLPMEDPESPEYSDRTKQKRSLFKKRDKSMSLDEQLSMKARDMGRSQNNYKPLHKQKRKYMKKQLTNTSEKSQDFATMHKKMRPVRQNSKQAEQNLSQQGTKKRPAPPPPKRPPLPPPNKLRAPPPKRPAPPRPTDVRLNPLPTRQSVNEKPTNNVEENDDDSDESDEELSEENTGNSQEEGENTDASVGNTEDSAEDDNDESADDDETADDEITEESEVVGEDTDVSEDDVSDVEDDVSNESFPPPPPSTPVPCTVLPAEREYVRKTRRARKQ